MVGISAAFGEVAKQNPVDRVSADLREIQQQACLPNTGTSHKVQPTYVRMKSASGH